MADETFDARGMKCPIPVLKAAKRLKALAPGDTLTVEATDPSAPDDFRNFCETSGNELVSLEEGEGLYTIVVRKTA
jgi:tRNA 2-thiouridine synthesizing protein A